MSWIQNPVDMPQPDFPIEAAAQYRWIGTGADSGLFLQRFASRYDYGGVWILSRSLRCNFTIGDKTVVPQPSSICGRAWFSCGSWNCYYAQGMGYIFGDLSAGYTPSAEYDEETSGYVGDGWYEVSFPSQYDSIGRATPRGTLLNSAETSGKLAVSMSWPRYWKDGSSWSTNARNPVGKYENALDDPDFGPLAVGLPEWRKDGVFYPRSLEKVDGHFVYGAMKYSEDAGAYILGEYGSPSGWYEAGEPEAESPWEWTAYTSSTSGREARGTTSASWYGYIFGDYAGDAFCGEIAVWG